MRGEEGGSGRRGGGDEEMRIWEGGREVEKRRRGGKVERR